MTSVASVDLAGDLKGEAEVARAYAVLAKRALVGAHLFVRATYRARALARSLRRLIDRLRSGVFEEVDAAEARDIARDLRAIQSQVMDWLRFAEQHHPAFPWHPIWRFTRSFQKSAEDLGDIIESIELALNPDFRGLVEEAICQLKPPEDHPRDWRSSLAAMQD